MIVDAYNSVMGDYNRRLLPQERGLANANG